MMYKLKKLLLFFMLSSCFLGLSSRSSMAREKFVNEHVIVILKTSNLERGIVLDSTAVGIYFDPDKISLFYNPEPRWIAFEDIERITSLDGALLYGQPLIKKQLPSYAPTLAFLGGIPLGMVMGGLVGTLAPKDFSSQIFENAVNGALIGMSVMPFLLYEITRARMEPPADKNRLAFHTGPNVTSANYDATRAGTGYMIGFNRYYYADEHTDIVAGLSYNMRTFELHDQIVYLPFMGGDVSMSRQNITFAVGYVDVHVMPQFNFKDEHVRLSAGIGLSLSARVFEKTRRKTLERTYYHSGIDEPWQRPSYDFLHIDMEPEMSTPYFGWIAAVEVDVRRIAIRMTFKKAFGDSRQMSPLDDFTQLRTLSLSLGYLF
jgi:hypothetical protein